MAQKKVVPYEEFSGILYSGEAALMYLGVHGSLPPGTDDLNTLLHVAKAQDIPEPTRLKVLICILDRAENGTELGLASKVILDDHPLYSTLLQKIETKLQTYRGWHDFQHVIGGASSLASLAIDSLAAMSQSFDEIHSLFNYCRRVEDTQWHHSLAHLKAVTCRTDCLIKLRNLASEFGHWEVLRILAIEVGDKVLETMAETNMLRLGTRDIWLEVLRDTNTARSQEWATRQTALFQLEREKSIEFWEAILGDPKWDSNDDLKYAAVKKIASQPGITFEKLRALIDDEQRKKALFYGPAADEFFKSLLKLANSIAQIEFVYKNTQNQEIRVACQQRVVAEFEPAKMTA